MKTLGVGELKADFSSVLDEVCHGHPEAIGYGKKKKRFAPWLKSTEDDNISAIKEYYNYSDKKIKCSFKFSSIENTKNKII